MRYQILGMAVATSVALMGACGGGAPAPYHAGSAGSGSGGSQGGSAGSGSAGSGSAGSGSAGSGSAGSGSAGSGSAGSGSAGSGAAGVGSAGSGAAGSAGSGTAGTGAAGATAGNWKDIPGLEDLSTVKKSAGCGVDLAPPTGQAAFTLGQWSPKDNHDYQSGYTIPIMTPANHPLASIAGKVLQRRYFLKIPANYDKNTVYKVIYEGAGCTGRGTDVADFFGTAAGKAIVVGLEIYPNVWGGGSDISGRGDPGVSCFDDKRGATTIEKPFIEALHERLKAELCFDEHRVFIAGHSSGGWLSNQFGNAHGSKIFRAIAPSSGGLAQGNSQEPTDGLPVPGFWFHQPNDGTNGFQGSHDAITHALMVNKCTASTTATGTSFAPSTTMSVTFPGVGSPCVKFSTCDAAFPIVLCMPAGNDHSNNHDNGSNRTAVWNFFDSF
jgi:polyhydroxybutyrate depolymerase